MSEATNEIPLDRKLNEIFDEGYSAMHRLDENAALPSNAPEFQVSLMISGFNAFLHVFPNLCL